MASSDGILTLLSNFSIIAWQVEGHRAAKVEVSRTGHSLRSRVDDYDRGEVLVVCNPSSCDNVNSAHWTDSIGIWWSDSPLG